MKKPRQPHMLLDYLIAAGYANSDAEIARRIDMAPSNVSRVRIKIRPLGSDMRLSVMRAFDLTWQKVDELCPPEGK